MAHLLLQLERFGSNLCGFVQLAKYDTVTVKKETCFFLWENVRKTLLNQH